MDTITLSEAGRPQSVKVHPLVLFSILDHYTRRPEQQEDGRVIGTLLGWVSDKHVEIVNSFAVPHSEKADEVAVGQNYNKTMYSLHQRVNKREQVVGWCAAPTTPVCGHSAYQSPTPSQQVCDFGQRRIDRRQLQLDPRVLLARVREPRPSDRRHISGR